MAGLYYEEFFLGQEFDHPWSRTVTEMDNTLFSALTLNVQPLHLDAHFAAGTEFGQRIVNSMFTAGLMVPFIFTGILYSALGIVSPILNQRIDWFWFVISQIFFGLVCGFVVNLQDKVRTPQFQALPFAVRCTRCEELRELDQARARRPAQSQDSPSVFARVAGY